MTPQLEAYERAIVDTERAGEEYARWALLETTLQNGRHGVKQEAIKRLMTPRKSIISKESLTQVSGKEHTEDIEETIAPAASSVSAAEKLVETDLEYFRHLEAERDATFQKNMAYTRLITSRLRALGQLVDLLRTVPHGMASLLATEVDLDLIRAKDDARERLVGGVPR